MSIVLLQTNSLLWALAIFSIVWWLFYLIYDRKLVQDEDEGAGGESTKALLRYAFPLGLSAAVHLMTFSIPRIVLEQYADAATLGIFAALGHLLLIGTLAINSVASAIVPRLSRAHAAGDQRSFVMISLGACALAALGAIIFMAVAHLGGEWLVTIIYGADVAMYSDLLLIISYASLPMYVGAILAFVPPAALAFRFALIVSLITLGGTSLASFILIPTFGIDGAVYAVIVQGVLTMTNGLILFFKAPKSEKEALA